MPSLHWRRTASYDICSTPKKRDKEISPTMSKKKPKLTEMDTVPVPKKCSVVQSMNNPSLLVVESIAYQGYDTVNSRKSKSSRMSHSSSNGRTFPKEFIGNRSSVHEYKNNAVNAWGSHGLEYQNTKVGGSNPDLAIIDPTSHYHGVNVRADVPTIVTIGAPAKHKTQKTKTKSKVNKKSTKGKSVVSTLYRSGSNTKIHRVNPTSHRVNPASSRSGSNTRSQRVTSPAKHAQRSKSQSRKKVIGLPRGLFHCVGAGARSRSCTPERNTNLRVAISAEDKENVQAILAPFRNSLKKKLKSVYSGSSEGSKGGEERKSRKDVHLNSLKSSEKREAPVTPFTKLSLKGAKEGVNNNYNNYTKKKKVPTATLR